MGQGPCAGWEQPGHEILKCRQERHGSDKPGAAHAVEAVGGQAAGVLGFSVAVSHEDGQCNGSQANPLLCSNSVP